MKLFSRKVLKLLTPPIVPVVLNWMHYGRPFSGEYASWEEAERSSAGYGADVIIDKVKEALLQVREGRAVCERDSVLLDKNVYSWPLLAGLMWCASRSHNKLILLDFGGSLGTTFFQNRKFLNELDELLWCVVEQDKFVDCGKKYFEDDHLKFYRDIDSCVRERRPDVLVISGVLQYLEKPYERIEEMLKYDFEYILIDRTLFLEAPSPDRLTVQHVPPEYYGFKASYPAWFFNENDLLDHFTGRYDVVEEFPTIDGEIHLAGVGVVYKGFILRLKKK